MYDAGKIITGLIVFFCLLSFPVWVSAAKQQIKDDPQANALLTKPYRKPYVLPEV